MAVMADLLRRGHYADEAIPILATERAARSTGVGGNDPCPCGSGRSYKRCHLDGWRTDR
jgi:uncharacterized protein YecA (UPF0149 family)